jgi:hypothetical protein
VCYELAVLKDSAAKLTFSLVAGIRSKLKDNKANTCVLFKGKSEPSKSDTGFGSAATEIVNCNKNNSLLIWSVKQCTACPESYYAGL